MYDITDIDIAVVARLRRLKVFTSWRVKRALTGELNGKVCIGAYGRM